LTCGIGKRRSSLFKSLRISGARRVGRRLPLYAVLTVVVTLCTVALIEEEGGNVTRSKVSVKIRSSESDALPANSLRLEISL